MGSNNGVYSNTPTLGETGILGTAVRFNNSVTNQLGLVPSSSDFSIDNGVSDSAFSLSVWINPFATFGSIVSKNNSVSGQYEWELLASGGKFRFDIYNSGISSGKIIISPVSTITTLSFVHVVITYDGSGTIEGCNIYINGVADKNTDLSFVSGTYIRSISTPAPLRIANSESGNDFNGIIDELCIWKNRELSPAEISEIYNSGTGLNLT